MLIVHLRITDSSTGKPTPARLRVSGADGRQFLPLGRSEFPTGRNEDVGGHLQLGRERWYYIDGSCEIPLPTGVPLRVQAEKGPHYSPLDEIVTLGSGQISLRFAIKRSFALNAQEWRSVDIRCHFLSPHSALLEAAAEDVDVVNLLVRSFPVLANDGHTYAATPNLLAFSGQSPALAHESRSVVVNTINSHPVLGTVALLNSHRPVFPLSFGGEETDDWSVCDWCDQCHRKGGLTVWVEAFEPAGGICGGEALVAAILGKIDAIEVSPEPRKVPLLPWVYRLWNAGYLIPLVGGSGKDSNRITLGGMRTYARISESGSHSSLQDGGKIHFLSWIEAIREGATVVSTGPLLDWQKENDRIHVKIPITLLDGRIELIADGEVIAATDQHKMEFVVPRARWIAARLSGTQRFVHSSAIALDRGPRDPASCAALRQLVEQTRDWIQSTGRFSNPKRREALLLRCDEALARLIIEDIS